MLYLTILLMSIVLVNKAYTLFSYPMSVSAFLWPIWFVLNSVIAEVYGYRFCQKLFYYAIFCAIMFVIGVNLFIGLSVPDYYSHLSSYHFVFGDLGLFLFAFFLGLILGNYLNSYIGVHWTFLSKLPINWIKVLLSSIAGQCVFVFVVTVVMLFPYVPFVMIFHSFLIMFLVVIVMTVLLSYPAGILITILRLQNNKT